MATCAESRIKMRLRSLPFFTLLFVLAVALIGQSGVAQVTKLYAITGQDAPDNNGTFSFFPGNPVINNAGQVGFLANLFNTDDAPNDDSGVFVADGNSIFQVAREGVQVPGGDGMFSGMGRPALNDSGQSLFSASLINTSGGSIDNQALYRNDPGGLIEIARKGQSAPDGNGTFTQFTGESSINNNGNVLFEARIDGTSSGNTEWGIFQSDGSTITRLVRSGQLSPDGNGDFSLFNKSVRNSSGEVAFTALLDTNQTSLTRALFMTVGGSLTHVARAGDTAPDGNGIYDLINDPDISDNGKVAFRGQFTDTIQGPEDSSGIFVSDGSITSTIVRRGSISPDGDGQFSFFASSPRINSSGQVAILATVVGTASGDSESILMRSEANLDVGVIARSGDAAPDGNGVFDIVAGSSAFNTPLINDLGQMVFEARMTATSGGSSDDYGLFIYDDLNGIRTVVREGDSYLGSVITNFTFEKGSFAYSTDRDGFNEFGQVTYSFSLADGRRGIAVYNSVPEPSTAVLVGIALLGLFQFRRLRRADLSNECRLGG